MVKRTTQLWDWRKGKEHWITTSYVKPKGFYNSSFTDVPKTKKELEQWKKRYIIKVARNPYGSNADFSGGGKGKKVMFYKSKWSKSKR